MFVEAPFIIDKAWDHQASLSMGKWLKIVFMHKDILFIHK